MKIDVKAIAKAGAKYLPVVAMGVMTVVNGISDQKKADEFEAMKKTLDELQKK